MSKKNNISLISIFIRISCILFSITIAYLSRDAFLFFMAGMLPSIVAVTVDNRVEKCASSTVCAFNLIGVMPFMFEIFQGSSYDNVAKAMLRDAFVWFIMYAATSIGWVLLLILPKITSLIFIIKTRATIQSIKKEQHKLIEDWGEGVKFRG